MDPAVYRAFDARLSALENQARMLRDDLNAAAPADAPEPAAAAAGVPPSGHIPLPVFLQDAPRAAAYPAAPRAKSSLETLIAGRGLQLGGLLLVLLGTAFFLELAFTNGWIGPAQRILLGLIAGSALIVVGARMLRGRYDFLAEGLVGLGAGILYLSMWASVAVFPLLHVSRVAAFAAMIGVTTVVAVLSAVHRSERLALIGLVGGFLTPALLNSGTPAQTTLAAYLLVLGGGMLALAARGHFRSVETVTFVATLFYAGAFAVDPATHWTELDAYVVASLFFLEFAASFSFGALRSGAASPLRVSLLAADVGFYALALELIFNDRQTSLGVALLALAAALLAIARLKALPPRMTVTYGYLGLAIVTLAFPALVHHTSLLDVFAIEAGLLVVLGCRSGDRWIVIAGAALFALTGIVLFGDAQVEAPKATVVNELSLGFVLWIGSLVFARTQLLASPLFGERRQGWAIGANVAFNAMLVTALSRELLDLLGGPHWNQLVPSHAQLALSLLWALYAAVLFGLGLRNGSALMRWEGLALFGLTVCKLFLVDLSSLSAGYRVGSFVGLGIVMVAVSAWYSRAMMRRAPEPEA